MSTENYNLPTITGNMTADVVRDVNALAEATDDAIKLAADEVSGDITSHKNNKNNPHGVTKAQVGLSGVENYGVATQVEAEGGTSNMKYMTPIRTQQAIASQALLPLAMHAENNNIHLSPGDISRLANSVQKLNEEYNTDPNTTLAGFILTQHANNPTAAFWYIWTGFYNGVGVTSNRAQYGINYITGEFAFRIYRNLAWEPWQRIGDLRGLPTIDKTVSGAISELFQSVSNGKSLVANAIRLQGVPTADNAEFATMASNIGKINSGASGTGQLSASALSFRYYETTNTLNFYNLTVSGLNFKPRFITAYYKRGSLNYQAIYNNVNLAESISTYGFGGAETTGVIRHLKMGVSSGYVNSTGFRIPIVSTSDVTSSDQGTINWYAFP